MSSSIPSKIKFDYIKSPVYRTTHIDGAFGGLTPKGYISAALFSERLPIPRSTSHKFDGQEVGEEFKKERETREAVIRELELNCIMDVATARIIAKWLLEKADEVESIQEKVKNAR